MRTAILLHPAMILLLVTTAFSGDGNATYELSRWTIDGGGATSSDGAGYELRSTIGQPDGGALVANEYELNAGFWYPVSPTDCVEDGYVDLLDYSDFHACATGPGTPVTEGCECFDVDQNGSVDILDFGALQTFFNGNH